jgi:hypothetical protein
MAIVCPGCGTEYDVTLFAFERELRCSCGAVVDLAAGHTRTVAREDAPEKEEADSPPSPEDRETD